MGIPSYFSHIVKQHRAIIRPYLKGVEKISNLYLDCNSIIYDAVHNKDTVTEKLDEKKLIASVCDKLVYYIQLIEPSKRVFIAFDGIAPIAKLNQQRNRRYMSLLQQQLEDEKEANAAAANASNKNNKEVKKKPEAWNTSAITPGTEFMKQLGIGINERFLNKHEEFGLEKIKISAADEAGEGEHKIYEYIRENPAYHKETKTIIYGLDADLIMLTLNHLHISSELYLFRETPHFIQQIDKTLDPNENYVMDINKFGESIIKELTFHKDPKAMVAGESASALASATTTNADAQNIIFDYIFMCFFLGNDFLPHFPALNIRTNGINYLMSAYSHVFYASPPSAPKLTAEKGTVIVWKNVHKFVEYLSANELEYIQGEYKKRDRMTKNLPPDTEDDYLSIPMRERSIEKYINPFESGWETRYYKTLFEMKTSPAIKGKEEDQYESQRIKISKNYLEGLEWTMKYYTSGCVDWRWHYKYHYPPLLVDLIKYMPYFETCLVKPQLKNPVLPLVQLCYVLPEKSLFLLPSDLHRNLLKYHSMWYTKDCDLKWSFCKYLWEAHACLPPIDISTLDKFVRHYMNCIQK